jgi:transcriptional regulator with XRE-family HTH domain
MKSSARPVGDLLRQWRQRRRLSQLDLACEANISARHLSFLETGRSRPSRDMVLHLAEQLEVPPRERNALLSAAGYAPAYAERRLDDPALEPARRAIGLVLKGHEPFPALAFDRRYNLVAANAAVRSLTQGCDPELLQPPVNTMRVALHPRGMAPRIANYVQWRAHLLDQVARAAAASADAELEALHRELATYPAPESRVVDALPGEADYAGVVVPLRLVTPRGLLNFVTTVTVFGTPMDITLTELALETFFPADEATAAALRGG